MSTAEDDVLVIESLNKIYAGGFEALKDINLRIQRGEIFALLGPNGAGKTTLISIICGIVSCSSGRVRVDGFDIVQPATSYWRLSMWASLALLVSGLVIHFARPYKPH